MIIYFNMLCYVKKLINIIYFNNKHFANYFFFLNSRYLIIIIFMASKFISKTILTSEDGLEFQEVSKESVGIKFDEKKISFMTL